MNLQPIEVLAEQIVAGNRRALAQAITVVESANSEHRKYAINLLEQLMPYTGQSTRLGVSGAPGVGKSTFIEAIGHHIIDSGRTLAVLSVDPTSSQSGGSILGDKTRMSGLSKRAEVFIRPSPSGSVLGGISRHTQEALLLCEAAGYDIIMIETVGVGQSESLVSSITDMFILLIIPGAGDQLQGIKKGIMEFADLIVVNKADDDLLPHAEVTQTEYQKAVQLHPEGYNQSQIEVCTCSARDGTGIEAVWRLILRHRQLLDTGKQLTPQRLKQSLNLMWSEVNASLAEILLNDEQIRPRIVELESAISIGKITPLAAAQELLELVLEQKKTPRDSVSDGEKCD